MSNAGFSNDWHHAHGAAGGSLCASPLDDSPAASPLGFLLPYQRRWVDDGSRFKIGLWSRQVGKSFSCAAEAVRDSFVNPGSMWVVLSAGERQALEFMEKAKQWARAFEFAMDGYEEARGGSECLIRSAEIRWRNGSRMLALPANADTARGYSANLILDEFAFHEDSEEIWRCIYPSISNPLRGKFKLRIVSTPNGKGNKFHDLWVAEGVYSKHRVTIYEAAEAGLGVEVDELRRGLNDEEGWRQEFECEFLDGGSVLLPYELLEGCESGDACEDGEGWGLGGGDFYAGVDIGRKHDLTVVWVVERVDGVLWTRCVRVLERTPFHEQLEVLSGVVRVCRRVAVDATGVGAMLAEELARVHGSRVEECRFDVGLKEEIFSRLRRVFEEGGVRIPVSRRIREDLHGMQRVVRAGGRVHFTAPRNADGHCDRATALALAVRAGGDGCEGVGFQPFSGPSRVARVLRERRERML